MRYVLLLTLRSLMAVVVGITAVGVFGAARDSKTSLVIIPAMLFFGLLYFGIPSVIGMVPLLLMQDRGSLGENKPFIALASGFYGLAVGFIVATIFPLIMWRPTPSFDWSLSLLGALGGAVGGLYSGIRCVTKREPRKGISTRVTWSE